MDNERQVAEWQRKYNQLLLNYGDLIALCGNTLAVLQGAEEALAGLLQLLDTLQDEGDIILRTDITPHEEALSDVRTAIQKLRKVWSSNNG